MATKTDTRTLMVNRFEIYVRPGNNSGWIIEHHRRDGREWRWQRDTITGHVTFDGPGPPRYVCNTLYTALCEKGFLERGY